MALKKIVVGNTSYSFARRKNLALVDKTRFIERLVENPTKIDRPFSKRRSIFPTS